MRIDATINGLEIMTNDVNGLLRIMENENVNSCEVRTYSMGQAMTKMNMTINDVKEWSEMNESTVINK